MEDDGIPHLHLNARTSKDLVDTGAKSIDETICDNGLSNEKKGNIISKINGSSFLRRKSVTSVPKLQKNNIFFKIEKPNTKSKR